MSVFYNLIYIIRITRILLICKFFYNKKTCGPFLTKSLEKLGPSFIKFGQALSVRADIIGQDIADSLAKLQDKMPAFAATQASLIITKELGQSPEDIFAEFQQDAVAAASIAQVHKAKTKCGQQVAIKILRPKIEKKFRTDLRLFYFIAKIIAIIPYYKRLRPIEVVDVFAKSVKKELDLRIEAASASQLASNCKNDPNVKIPKIFWQYTTRRILVTSWVDGIALSDKASLANAGYDLDKVSKNLTITFLNQSFRDGFFHADIHPGNLFIDHESNIIPVDFGIVGHLDKDTIKYVAQILRGFMVGDYMHVAKIHFCAGYVAKDKSLHDFALACRAIGEPIQGLDSKKVSIGKLLALLFKITQDFDMHTQPQLLLLQKTMVQIEGVCQDLNPDINMWQIADEWTQEWSKENLTFNTKVKTHFNEILESLQNLPQYLQKIDTILENLSKEKTS